MKLQNAIKKAEKLSGEKIQKNDTRLHWVNYKGYTIQFYPNGREDENVEATNYYTRRHDLRDDHQSDYFAGTFWDNITQCFNHIDRMTADKYVAKGHVTGLAEAIAEQQLAQMINR